MGLRHDVLSKYITIIGNIIMFKRASIESLETSWKIRVPGDLRNLQAGFQSCPSLCLSVITYHVQCCACKRQQMEVNLICVLYFLCTSNYDPIHPSIGKYYCLTLLENKLERRNGAANIDVKNTKRKISIHIIYITLFWICWKGLPC